MKFIIITVVFMTVVIMLTCGVLRKLLEGERLKKARKTVIAADVIAVFGMSFAFGPLQGHWLAGPLIQGISIVFMAQLLFVVLMLLALAGKFLYCKTMDIPESSSRRRFLKGAALLPIVSGSASVYAGFYERKSVVVREYSVPVKGLDSKLEGYRIAQLSDIHLGPFMGLEDFKALMDKVSEQKPHILAITGDLFDNRQLNSQAAKLLDGYCDSFYNGIVFCRGNHEHFRGIQAIDLALNKTRIQVLVNENIMLVDGTTPLYFSGVDYPMKREAFDELQKKYTEKALKGIPNNGITVMLAHHPDFLDTAAEYGVRLVLSGHTHGGQLGVCGIPLVPPVFKYLRGWYRKGTTDCYVHSGNGSWFPYRLGCPPEIAVFTLTGSED